MAVKAIHYGLEEEHETVYECDGFGFTIVRELSDDERRYNSILFQYGQWPRSVWPESIDEEASALEIILCLSPWKS